MADENAERRKVLKLIESMDYAVFTTRGSDGEPLHGRPMAYRAVDDDADLWFFSKRPSRKTKEIEADPRVLVSFADPKAQHFVSITGRAEVVSDRSVIAKRWSEIYRAWFPGGPDDDNVILIRVRAERAEYWDTPTSAMVYAFGYSKAVATGKPSHAGEVGQVNL